MSSISLTMDFAAPSERVWDALADIGTHHRWMEDAVAIRFTGPATRGLGTTFDCDTRIGPFALVDRMTITEWEEGHRIGVAHTGIVTGSGVFTLASRPSGGSTVTWTEDLTFPWWLAGPLGAGVARPVLRSVWRRNLRNLRRLVDELPAV